MKKLKNIFVLESFQRDFTKILDKSLFLTFGIPLISIGKEIKDILQSIEDEKEAIFIALFWASQKSLLETFKKIGLRNELVEDLNEVDKKIIIRAIKRYKEEIENLFIDNMLEEDLIENLENFNIFDFQNNDIVKVFIKITFNNFENEKEFLSLLERLKNEDKIKYAGLKRLKNEFIVKFERFFWFFIEKEEYKNKFGKILAQIDSQQNLKKLEEYLISKYYRNIVKKFEEPIFNDERNVSLKEVYIEQFFKIYEDNLESKDNYFLKNKFIELKNNITTIKLINNFLEKRKEGNIKCNLKGVKILLVLGQAGDGKSSLTKKIIYDFCENEINTNNIYLLELRRLDRKDLINFTIETLENELKTLIFGKKKNKFNLPNFENSTIILDGLDEILMQEELLTDKAESLIKNLLWNIKNKDEYKNIRFIITSREGYINLDDIYPQNKNDILTIKLREFIKEQQIEWLEKYIKIYPEKKDYLKLFKNLKLPNHIEELVSQPILLYMIVSSDIPLEELINKNKSYIYNKLFDYIVERKWSKTNEHPNLKVLSKELLRDILREIAFTIFKSKYEYIHSYDIYNLSKFNDYLNLFNVKNNKSKIRELFKGLLIAFYLREVKTEWEDEKYLKEEGFPIFAVEFFHKSLQEYLTAEYIFNEVIKIGVKHKRKFAKNDREVLNLIWELFSEKKLTLEIRDYLEEIIEENKNNYIEEINNIFLRVPIIYENLFERSFIAKIKNIQQEDGIYKPLFVFGNFWLVLKLFFKDKKLLQKLNREKFIEFLKLSQSNGVSFIEKLLLMFEDLNKADLKNINLKGANLFMASLIETDLNKTNLKEADLINTKFFKANLKEADLEKANLVKADLREANLSEANLKKANLRMANLREANLNRANLKEAYLKEANLKKANLREANLSKANLSKTNLNKVDLREANLRGAYLFQANLREADLNKANLKGANFSEAKLRGANLNKTDLRGVNFNKADLKKAHVNKVDLRLVNFKNVKDIETAFIDEETKKYLQENYGFKFGKD